MALKESNSSKLWNKNLSSFYLSSFVGSEENARNTLPYVTSSRV